MRFFLALLLPLLSFSLTGQSDSLLSNFIWVEERQDGEVYTLRLDEYGSFEEDAGEKPKRKSRYLMGRWETDSLNATLTLAVDYFLGEKMVHRRYRKGTDFYIVYNIVSLSTGELVVEDVKTGELRTYRPVSLNGYKDAGERKAEAIQLKTKKGGGFEIPDGW